MGREVSDRQGRGDGAGDVVFVQTCDVLEEQVCVCGGIDVTACAYLRVYVSVCIVCMLLIFVCACVHVCMYVCTCVFFTLQHVHKNVYIYIEQTAHG